LRQSCSLSNGVFQLHFTSKFSLQNLPTSFPAFPSAPLLLPRARPHHIPLLLPPAAPWPPVRLKLFYDRERTVLQYDEPTDPERRVAVATIFAPTNNDGCDILQSKLRKFSVKSFLPLSFPFHCLHQER